jgi:hypothetical protein
MAGAIRIRSRLLNIRREQDNKGCYLRRSPLVVLHGSQMDGASMERLTGLDSTADQAGFAVAYPTALNNNTGYTVWNIFYNDFSFPNPPTMSASCVP